MNITGLMLANIPPISERIKVEFDDRANLFVGPNASGKSTIMRWMASNIGRAVPHKWLLEYIEEGSESNYLSVSEDWREAEYGNLLPVILPPIITINWQRPLLPELSEEAAEDERSMSAMEILERDFSGTNLKLAVETLSAEVWDMEPDRSSPYISLKGNKWENYYRHPERHNLLKVRDITDRCVQMICGELIRGSSSHNYVPGPDVRGYLQGPRGAEPLEVHLNMAVDTNDIRNFDHLSPYERPSASAYYQDADSLPIYAGHLSAGTQGTLLWVRWLALKMVNHYGFRTDWEEMPAILLIDEIENHLHPTWQRRVIPALLEHFPGLQIFATTHSPFVVAGLKAGQVHLLDRDENGVVTATTNTEDIVGWTADEILRTMMGVADPTDDETARNAAELRRLRDAGTQNTPEEEERRQEEMQRLRRSVNRDLLAGGPREAQRELFEQQFGEALEKYLQS